MVLRSAVIAGVVSALLAAVTAESARPLPVLGACGTKVQLRPRTIISACDDGNFFGTRLRWTRSGSSSWEVHPDGRIGPLEIDVSTEADIRHFAGNPFKVADVFSPAKRRAVGYELYYRCGRGCITSYAISNATRRLSDYHTQSPRFVTEHGSRVGMSARRAAALERRNIVGGCGEGRYVHLRWDEHHIFVLGVFKGKVSLIAYLGPHTLSYEGLC